MAEGTTTVIGTAEVLGTTLLFTPFADVSDVVARFDYRVTDELGTTAEQSFTFHVKAVPDATALRVLGGGQAGTVAAVEDTPSTGQILIADPDLLANTDLTVAQKLAYLAFLDDLTVVLDQPTLDTIAALEVTLLDTEIAYRDPLQATTDAPDHAATSPYGALTFTPTANPLIWEYAFDPAADQSGVDLLDLRDSKLEALSGGTVGEEIVSTSRISLAVAEVNDAPGFTGPHDPEFPWVVEPGSSARFNLLADGFDIDGRLPPGTILIGEDELALPLAEPFEVLDAEGTLIARITVSATGFVEVEGIATGRGSFTFSAWCRSD